MDMDKLHTTPLIGKNEPIPDNKYEICIDNDSVSNIDELFDLDID